MQDTDLVPIKIPPGFVADLPDYASSGLWINGDKIRFRNGLPETIGAWGDLSPGNKLIGVPRALASWRLLNGTRVMAVGTNAKLYIYRGGAYYDITPIRASDTAGADPIATSFNSSTVVVTISAHGATKGDYVRFSGATTTNGLDVNGEWVISKVNSNDEFEFQHTDQATSTGSGGGASVAYEFDIHAGTADSTPALGYGAGPYGAGPYGGARSSSLSTLEIRTWSLDNYGEDLVASPSNGGLYFWDASTDVSSRAVVVAGAPTSIRRMVFSPNDRHTIALGVDGDPLLIKWNDQGVLTNWTPGITSTANTRRLQEGSRIVTGVRARNEIMIFTDTALYGHRYVGQGEQSHVTYRIGFVEPPVGPNAVAVFDDEVWWLGAHQFYRFKGTIEEYPTTISETVAAEIDSGQGAKVFAGTLREQNEIYWFYPKAVDDGSKSENSRYAKLNIKTGAADLGNLARTAWIDSLVFTNPIAATSDGELQQHGLPGQVNPSVDIEFEMYNYSPFETPTKRGPFTITPTVRKLNRRLRGRHAKVKYSGTISCNGTDEPWFIESGVFDIGNGDQVMFVDTIIPDIKFGKSVTIGHLRVNPEPDGEQ